MKKLYVLGAGITGIGVAYKLAKSYDKVEIFEKEEIIGGLSEWKSLYL